MANRTYDAVVIGGGPGGYSCAIRLGQLKQKVACVEKDEVGGVCLNWGCIPSKALIATSHLYEKTRHAATMGIKVASVELDVNAMQDWKGGIVKKLTTGVRGLLKGNGSDLIIGTAVLVGPNALEVTSVEGKKETIEAKSIVLATGSSTIGLELGCVYQKLGSAITVVEMTPTLLPGTDPECTAVVERKMVKLGAKIMKSAKALGYERQKDGSLAVRVESEGKHETVETDCVLVAVGMKPNSKGIGLEKVGVKIDERGFVPTDKFGRTNVPSIYAIGDVSGPPLLAHKASKEAEIVAEVIAGHKAAKDWVAIAAAIFTDPEIASVGLTEAEAKQKGIDVQIGKMPFSASGRALAVAETEGFIKMVADKKTHQLLGVHIVGPSASDLISEGALAIEMAAFLEDVGLTVHPHPTLGEAVMIAAQHG